MDEGRSLPVMVTSFLIHLRQLTPPNLDEMLLLDAPLIRYFLQSVYLAISTGLLGRTDYRHSSLFMGRMDRWMDGRTEELMESLCLELPFVVGTRTMSPCLRTKSVCFTAGVL